MSMEDACETDAQSQHIFGRDKKVTEKAQKQAKMARFWPKRRTNGRVMARDAKDMRSQKAANKIVAK